MSGVAWVASYQLVPVSLLKLQADLEFFPQGFLGSGEEAWAPQVYIVLGRSLYAAAGAARSTPTASKGTSPTSSMPSGSVPTSGSSPASGST